MTDLPAASQLLAASPQEQIEGVHALLSFLLERIRRISSGGGLSFSGGEGGAQNALESLIKRILQRGHPYTERDLSAWIALCCHSLWYTPVSSVVGAVERTFPEPAADGPLGKALTRLHKRLGRQEPHAATQRLLQRVAQLLQGSPEPSFALEAVDAWTHALRRELEALPADDRGAWSALLAHAATATSTAPSRKWTASAQACLAAVGSAEFARLATVALRAVGTDAPFAVKIRSYWLPGGSGDGDEKLISEESGDCLRGLIWMTALAPEASLESELGDAGERCFKKLPGHGPLSVKAGNACLHVLSRAGSLRAVTELGRLQARAKHQSIRALIDKALRTAAERMGMEVADLEELAVPSFGLDANGTRSERLGDFTAELRVRGVQAIELGWRKADGSPQKAVPSEVKSHHSAELKDLTRSVNELKKLFPVQRDRVERLLLSGRTLALADWRSRYLEHPLIGLLARRLIWRFASGDEASLGAWSDGRLATLDDHTLALPDSTPVSLWHPISSSADTIRAWREWLAKRGVTQPFKQAHREIYRITEAELATRSYSNRFAAHVLRQHQLHELCRQRSWRYTLQGRFDSHNAPWLDLGPLGFRAELDVDPIEDLAQDQDEAIYLYVSTDQVRFHRSDAPEPLELTQVPPLVFTEVMRDVDLFVGVCSVATDPTWQDGGPGGRYRAYWERHAFGELGESARTRREVLERLLPQLEIASRCGLEGRFLTVRGDLRSYRIHLGSGNVHMSPDDQYLCIVQARSTSGGLLLPFEGDAMLSVILSKAFLLAADRQIRDPSIASQIRAG